MTLTVLDGGCHDGFAGQWLRERFDGDLVIDGIELHPGAAQKARERGYRRVEEGLCEDMPNLFEPGTYDAVALFEVLEHVPSMGRLLDAAEKMLKPGGLVFISTPDGTFGTGRNPHHLRALRSIDLADLLRRRGRLVDMTVGADTVTVASYKPEPRLADVAIYCGPGWDKWGPMDIATRGLGGSETAAVRLAEQLADIGWVVTVYGEVDEGVFRDVLFRSWQTFDPLEPRQAVISSRIPAIFDRPVAARRRILWVHDTDCGDQLTQARADAIDDVLVLSDWHRQHVQRRYPFAAGKLVRTRNGLQPSYFTSEPAPERRQRVVYTSSPDRGLDILLELWPRVREEVPDAELAFGYSPVYWRIAEQDPTVGAHAARVRELAAQPGVTSLGSLSQPNVARLLRSSLVWCHPSYSTPTATAFHETSCIAAMEAQAAGCLVVASDWGALPETVQVGRLVNGGPGSEKWQDALVREIVDGLTNPDTQAWAQKEGPRHALRLGWKDVAVQIAGLIR